MYYPILFLLDNTNPSNCNYMNATYQSIVYQERKMNGVPDM